MPEPARRLPRRLDATGEDLSRAAGAARAIARSVLGRDQGPMSAVPSMSHYVVLGADVVVKLVDAADHRRLDLEIALAAALPPGLGAPLLAGGRREVGALDVRYACFARVPGAAPGFGLPGVDATTARAWITQAVRRLGDLHAWVPGGTVAEALRHSPVHEGFTGRDALRATIEDIRAADHDGVIPPALLAGLATIAADAPRTGEAPGGAANRPVPVHADCDWDNWLVDGRDVTALLDFERARYGDPADDWVLLAATSGPHFPLVLREIVEHTPGPGEDLRAACEVRDAALIAHDLRHALRLPAVPPWTALRLRDLAAVVADRRWWQPVH